MVWAHFKLDTDDKEDILPYLKSSTINVNPEDDLLSDHSAEEDKPISVVEVSSYSIFDESIVSENLVQRYSELRDPTFCSKLDTISEIDEYGASLISLLSKTRPLTVRDSIPITYNE
jgi:hypothetical protein